MRTRPAEPIRRDERPALDLSKLHRRRWVTRPRPHIDRVASAWFIKRVIDPDAEFVFAPPAEFPKDAIPFDAPWRRAQSSGRGLHVRDAGQARADPRPSPRPARRGRPRSRSARWKVSARGGARD